MASVSDTNALKLQKKLDTLVSLVQAARDFSMEISDTYHVELQHSDTKFITHLLEAASQEIGKVIHSTEIDYPTLQRTGSQHSNASSASRYSDENLQRKRAESAVQKEKVNDLQDLRERLAKVMHYRIPPKSVKTEKVEETK